MASDKSRYILAWMSLPFSPKTLTWRLFIFIHNHQISKVMLDCLLDNILHLVILSSLGKCCVGENGNQISTEIITVLHDNTCKIDALFCISIQDRTWEHFLLVVIQILGVLPLKYEDNSSNASSSATSPSSGTMVSSFSRVFSIVLGTFSFNRF